MAAEWPDVNEVAELLCKAEGHLWVPAGGGMLICARCEESPAALPSEEIGES